MWREIGAFTYLVVFVEMATVVLFVLVFQKILLGKELNLGQLLWVGGMLLGAGILLNTWTGNLLGWKSLVGYSELRPRSGPKKSTVKGPFRATRHPTYLAHTLIFVGVFLITGFIGTGILALLDFLTSYFVIIPLEERELLKRFGEDYRRYQNRVPKFLPLRLRDL